MDDQPRSAALDIVESVRRMFKPYADKITAVFIFGSVARGTDTPRSDIDLMIIGELNYDTVYTITYEAGIELRRQVSPVLISPEDWRREASMPRSFIGKVRASPKVFVIGAEEDL